MEVIVSACVGALTAISLAAVSYTHLDVYKRQAFKFLLHSDLHLMSLIGVVGKQIHGHIIEKEKPYIVVKRPHADSFHMALDL